MIKDYCLDCFFIEESNDMGFSDFYCYATNKLHLEKCPEDCPYRIDKEKAIEIIKEKVMKKD